MLARNELPRIKTRSYPEAVAKRLNDEHLPHASRALGVAWYAALSRANAALAAFFEANGKYFFTASLILSGIGWFIATLDLAFSANRNAGKVGNYLYTTLYFLFYLATAAIFTFISVAAGSAMLVVAMFLDPAVNLGRAIYNGIRALLELDKSGLAYRRFADRGKLHALMFVLGFLASAAFIVLMFVPALPLIATVAIGVVGVVIVLFPYLHFGFLKLKSLFTKTVEQDYVPTVKPASTTKQLLILSDDELLDDGAALLPEEVSGGYYVDSIAYLPESWQSLRDTVHTHIAKLRGKIACDKGCVLEFIWSQEAKRLDKINALGFLDQLITHLAKEGKNLPASASREEPYRMAGYLYHYTDKNDLIDKIAALTLQKFPGAFQSFFKEVGVTESCFNQLFLCIISDQLMLNQQNNEARTRNAV